MASNRKTRFAKHNSQRFSMKSEVYQRVLTNEFKNDK